MKIRLIKIAALVTVYIFYAMYLFQPYLWADDFRDRAEAGKVTGTGILETFKNTVSNNPNTTVPNYDNAASQRSSYDTYYGDPAAMTAGASDQTRQWVTDTNQTRAQIDISTDPVFGYKCLQLDNEGKCIQWSSSRDILANTYTDCETIITPIYDDPPEYKQCTGTRESYNRSCSVKIHPYVEQETINVPCSEYGELDVKPGQLYARCKDTYNWYRKDMGGRAYVNDCNCANMSHETNWWCWSNPYFEANIEPPPGATHFTRSWVMNGCNSQGGWDHGLGIDYDWYWKYSHSRIERLYLGADPGACLDYYETINDGSCAVTNMKECDSNNVHCFQTIQNSAATGLDPMNEKILITVDKTDNYSCFALSPTEKGICTLPPDLSGWDCFLPLPVCIGLCPEGVQSISIPGYYQKIGSTEIVNPALKQHCEDFLSTPNWYNNGTPMPTVKMEKRNFYTNTFTCKIIPGELDNYNVCLNYYDVEVEDSNANKTVTETPQHVSWSEPYTLISPVDRNKSKTPYTLSERALWGGNPLNNYGNRWNTYTDMSCTKEGNTCGALVAEGCYYDKAECVDAACTQRIYTYKCGGTGLIEEYEKTTVCAGNIRCLGGECKEIERIRSGAFADAAVASEILNNMRIDSNQSSIFPGEPFFCQSSPSSCCDTQVAGISVADYILAASDMYTVGSAAVETFMPEMYEAAATAVNSLVTNVATELGIEMGKETAKDLIMEAAANVAAEAGALATEALVGVLGEALATAVIEVVGAIIATVASVLYVLWILYAIYKLLSFLYTIMFMCNEKDMMASVKLTLQLCHEVGEKRDNVMGMPLKTEKVFCCFNSLLARLIHEQGREQIGRGWGDAENPDCGGFSQGELMALDFSIMDLSEYMQYVEQKAGLTVEEQAESLLQAEQSAGSM